MARKRFSDLERVYDALKLAKVDVATLPQKLDIARYAKWKEGEAVRKVIVRPDLKKEIEVGIIMFGRAATNSLAKILVKTNERANDKFKNAGGYNLLGIEQAPAVGTYNYNSTFVPAKITFTEKGTKTSTTSDITGRKYKKNPGKTYTLPFGQTATNKNYLDALGAILALDAFETAYFMTAKNEQFRRD